MFMHMVLNSEHDVQPCAAHQGAQRTSLVHFPGGALFAAWRVEVGTVLACSHTVQRMTSDSMGPWPMWHWAPRQPAASSCAYGRPCASVRPNSVLGTPAWQADLLRDFVVQFVLAAGH